MKKLLLSSLLLLPLFSMAQRMETTENGLQYKLYKANTGGRKAVVGDQIEMHIRVSVEDSVWYDSRKMNNGQPVPSPVPPSGFKGDIAEGFTLMSTGDSAVFYVSMDSMMKSNPHLPPSFKAGGKMKYDVTMVSVKTKEEVQKEKAEKAAKQIVIDDKLLQDYFTKNNIKATKTESGLYYTIQKPGKGEKATKGQQVTVNYTGKTLDGTTFDSNVDSNFKHTQPFSFAIGQGQVIKGWDEGVGLMPKGTKCTLYIPSTLAYGERGPAQIGNNAILMFTVEVLDINDAPKTEAPAPKGANDPAKQKATDEKLLKEYFTKNKIKATKTASGLYYTVETKGDGTMPKTGQKVTVNYTGKTMDGKAFDSNVLPEFNHVQPFTFSIGQGQVIKGWDEGVALMSKGGKGTLYIPSGLAYGESGPPQIGANKILIFNVEVVDIN
jgi:FKBP-type peptidyl-prolyl cis-trans isomerase